MITWKNYEEYMMMYADGELKPAEEQELMSFLFEHPELQHELAAFSMSKLTPDTALVYDRKEELLQPVQKKVIFFAGWQRYAVAAGVAAVVFFTAMKFMGGNNVETTHSVATNAADAPATQPTINPVPQNTNPAPVDQQPAQRSLAMVNKTDVHAGTPAKQSPLVKRLIKKQTTVNAVATIAAPTETIERLQTSEIKRFSNDKKISEALVTNIPTEAIYIQEGDEEANKQFVIRVPIDELKRKGIENVNTAMASGVDRINDLKQELSGTSISLKVEKRRLIVSF
jgi:anti-sigma factor RsiW